MGASTPARVTAMAVKNYPLSALVRNGHPLLLSQAHNSCRRFRRVAGAYSCARGATRCGGMPAIVRAAMCSAALVVGRDGRAYATDQWPPSRPLWQGAQENLLIADIALRTTSWETLRPVERCRVYACGRTQIRDQRHPPGRTRGRPSERVGSRRSRARGGGASGRGPIRRLGRACPRGCRLGCRRRSAARLAGGRAQPRALA